MRDLSYDLLDKGKPVRFGARWLRAIDCPHGRKPGPYAAGPGTLSLAAAGRALFYVRLDEWRKGDTDAGSLGPALKPRRRISREQRRAFKSAVQAAKEHWRKHYEQAGETLPKPYRSPLQRLFRWRAYAEQILLASEREIQRFRNEQSVTYLQEIVIVADSAPDHIVLLPHQELFARAVIDADYQAQRGLPSFLTRCWVLDHSVGDSEAHLDGCHHPLPGDSRCLVDAHGLLAGHTSLPFNARKIPKTHDEYEIVARRNNSRPYRAKHNQKSTRQQ